MNRLLCARGIGPDNVKIEAVIKARRPKPFQGWSFLGLEDLFAWFVSGLAIKSEPLGKLTRYIEIFFWGQKQEKSFRKLNENIFTNAKTVGYIDTEAKTQFVTDAGLGDVLLQIQNREIQIISYSSCSQCGKRLFQTENEDISIIWVCARFLMYLYGIDLNLAS